MRPQSIATLLNRAKKAGAKNQRASCIPKKSVKNNCVSMCSHAFPTITGHRPNPPKLGRLKKEEKPESRIPQTRMTTKTTRTMRTLQSDKHDEEQQLKSGKGYIFLFYFSDGPVLNGHCCLSAVTSWVFFYSP